MLDPLLSHTVVKPERETFRYKANWHRPAAGTFESVPQGPLNATNEPQHLPPVSSRHIGSTPQRRNARTFGDTRAVGPWSSLGGGSALTDHTGAGAVRANCLLAFTSLEPPDWDTPLMRWIHRVMVSGPCLRNVRVSVTG